VFYGSLLLAGIFDAIASPVGIYTVGGFLLLVKPGSAVVSIVAGEVIVNGRNLGLFHAPVERVKDAHSLELAPQRVKPDHVYLLGDSRDDSNDSRFMGQVALEDITGKVTGIWLSGERAKVGTTFD
jgi:signal peptidase I